MSESKDLLFGEYSRWLDEQLTGQGVPHYSFLHEKFSDVHVWKQSARSIFEHYLASPQLEVPPVQVLWTKIYDNLHIEKLTWTLPFGLPTEAYFLKPLDHKTPLRGVLALHDHGLNKVLGKSKLVRIEDDTDESILRYQEQMYDSRAWANSLAHNGFAVLVHDVFPFGSRRILPSDVPSGVIATLMKEKEPQDDDGSWYHEFSGKMESVIAKSIFSAGLTWAGLTLAEDRVALQILADREDVDSNRLGCCGLSLGGLRADYLAGSSEMIKCAVSAGFMTTWNDFILHKASFHTWMYSVPGIPNLMGFPDIVSMTAPNPLLVLSCIDDELFTLSEVKKCEKNLREVYEKAGYPDHFLHKYHEGPHRFTAEMQMEAFDWLRTWL